MMRDAGAFLGVPEPNAPDQLSTTKEYSPSAPPPCHIESSTTHGMGSAAPVPRWSNGTRTCGVNGLLTAPR